MSAAPEGTPGHIDDQLLERLNAQFDRTLVDPNRLRVMAALLAVRPHGALTFTSLRSALGLTDGNLGSHLAVLIEVGYVATTTGHTGRRATKWYAATERGGEEFENHVGALKAISAAAARRDTPAT